MKTFIFSCLAWLSILTCAASAQGVAGYTVSVTYADAGDGTTNVTIMTTGLLADIDSMPINEAIEFSSFSNAVTPNVSTQSGTIDLVSISVTTPSAVVYSHTFDGMANDSAPAIQAFDNGVSEVPAPDLDAGLLGPNLDTAASGFNTSSSLDLSAETSFTVEFVVENNSSEIVESGFNGNFFGITSSATSNAIDGSALYNNAGSASGPAIGLQVGTERGDSGVNYVIDNAAGNAGVFTGLMNDFADDAPDAPDCIVGDINMSGTVDFQDIVPFIAILSDDGGFQCEADINGSGAVDFSDIVPFIVLLSAS